MGTPIKQTVPLRDHWCVNVEKTIAKQHGVLCKIPDVVGASVKSALMEFMKPMIEESMKRMIEESMKPIIEDNKKLHTELHTSKTLLIEACCTVEDEVKSLMSVLKENSEIKLKY